MKEKIKITWCGDGFYFSSPSPYYLLGWCYPTVFDAACAAFNYHEFPQVVDLQVDFLDFNDHAVGGKFTW